MIKSLFYKEWIKLRWVLLGAAILTAGLLVYILLSVREVMEFKSAMDAWYNYIHIQKNFYTVIKYNALAWGAIFAFTQFVFETRQRRLRLLFHLPLAHNRSLYWMMAAGLASLAAVCLLTMGGLAWITLAYFPAEVFNSVMWTIAPWLAAGFAAYFCMALFLLEPSWQRKVAFLFMGCLVGMLFFQGGGYDAYKHSLAAYFAFAFVLGFAPLLPAFRFKRGSY